MTPRYSSLFGGDDHISAAASDDLNDARSDARSLNLESMDGPRTPREPLLRRASTDLERHNDDEEEDEPTAASVELAAIMTTASTPVTPGPSSPPLEPPKDRDFVPPTRPSSTPFPNAQRRRNLHYLKCHSETSDSDDAYSVSSVDESSIGEQMPGLTIDQLPTEIHECILDHIFGYRVSTTSPSSLSIPSVNGRSWSTALRHSKRKELSNLALVNSLWRELVQERLFRHIKLKATIGGLDEASTFFVGHPHLRSYVKHIEIWFPVFEPKSHSALTFDWRLMPHVAPDGINVASYALPADNSTLEEAFFIVGNLFPEVVVMTLEGGERKKAPKIKFGVQKGARLDRLPKISTIHTLIVRGQWNIIRNYDDWNHISAALPNLEEWHGTYAKPKSKSYLSMAIILNILQPKISKLNLCLESDYRRELTCPPFYHKVSEVVHWCDNLANAAVGLEHLSYTGRICHGFFDLLTKYARTKNTKLKTIDITVKNCCRQNAQWNESGSGITDMHFIKAFENLVLGGIRALGRLKTVEYLRIRYVDLDSPVPPLNPYFIIRDGWCSGVWSESIVSELAAARPDAQFEAMAESFGEVGYNKEGRLVISPEFPKSRVLSLKLANYAMLSGGITIV